VKKEKGVEARSYPKVKVWVNPALRVKENSLKEKLKVWVNPALIRREKASLNPHPNGIVRHEKLIT